MMKKVQSAAIALAPLAFVLASCSAPNSGDSSATSTPTATLPFAITEVATLEEPWALDFEPGTGRLFITEKAGTMKFLTADGKIGTVTGIPQVAYGGQGGFGDVAFAPGYANDRNIYLTWAEPVGEGQRAVMGLGKLACSSDTSCAVEGLKVIWRQTTEVNRPAHFSHRIAFSPDKKYLFLTSGERAQGDPAQDMKSNLGKVLRLNLDGTPAAGNPFASQGTPTDQIWSYGHRNAVGLQFDSQGRLWDMEHGPNGGDELNLVKEGRNYGWPVVSDGDNYDGSPIPRNATRPEFEKPAISWNPVIAPGDFIFYSGAQFPEWRDEALIVGLKTQVLVRVKITGETATEVARYRFPGQRLRDIEQGPDGAIWIIGDGPGGKLMKLTPQQ